MANRGYPRGAPELGLEPLAYEHQIEALITVGEPDQQGANLFAEDELDQSLGLQAPVARRIALDAGRDGEAGGD